MNTIPLTWFRSTTTVMAAGLRASTSKHHHPACDRTGQNDCDCPDKTSGELFLESVNKALQASLEDTKEYKEEYKQRYELLTTLSGIAYDNLTPEDMWLPPDSQWRQFRFKSGAGVASDSSGQVLRQLQEHQRRQEGPSEAPSPNEAAQGVLHDPSKFLNPRSIGPDPHSRSGAKKSRRRA